MSHILRYMEDHPTRPFGECAAEFKLSPEDLVRHISDETTGTKGGKLPKAVRAERRFQVGIRLLEDMSLSDIANAVGSAVPTVTNDKKAMAPYIDRASKAPAGKSQRGRSTKVIQATSERNARAYEALRVIWSDVLRDLKDLENVVEHAQGVEDYVAGACAHGQELCESLGWADAAEWYQAAQAALASEGAP